MPTIPMPKVALFARSAALALLLSAALAAPAQADHRPGHQTPPGLAGDGPGRGGGGGPPGRGRDDDRYERDWDDDWEERWDDDRDGRDGVSIGIDGSGVFVSIGDDNRSLLLDCYRRGAFGSLDSLPPGIARQVARGRPLPPGIARQIGATGCTRVAAPDGFRFVLAGDDVLLVEIGTQIIHDVLRLLSGD